MEYNYELLPKLTHLTLTGQDEEGLEFIGSLKQWYDAGKMQDDLCA